MIYHNESKSNVLSEFSCEIDDHCRSIGGITCDTVTNNCLCKPGWYSPDCSGVYYLYICFFKRNLFLRNRNSFNLQIIVIDFNRIRVYQ